MAAAAHSRARRKELGAFYTPPEMAAKLVEWAVRAPSDTVLDPSFGGFVFLNAARDRLLALGADRAAASAQLCGIDLDADAHRAARGRAVADYRLIEADFFRVVPSDALRFTANIGNPPYVRYQSWNGHAKHAHALTEALGVPLTRLASTWAPFILHGCRFLAEDGRLAQVLPAELLHSQYARPVVEHLIASFKSVTVATFDRRVFPGALEEVVLHFADGFGRGPARGLRLVACRDLGDLTPARIAGRGRGYVDLDLPLLSLLSPKVQRLYRQLAADANVRQLGAVADVDIGAVTGANRFFMRTRAELRTRRLPRSSSKTAISRATDLKGARLSDSDVRRLDADARSTALLVLKEAAHSDDAVRALIEEGRRAGFDRRYKCRIRKPWYAVPLPRGGKPPDAFLTYMSNAFPRLVANEAGALSTNTIHNVWLSDGVSASTVTAGFYNSLTLLSAELVGRSYGGGILKLEPTEAERLLLPPLTDRLDSLLGAVDDLLRARHLDAVLDVVDAEVLTPLDLTRADIAALRTARQNLAGRRRARNRSGDGETKTNPPARHRSEEATRSSSRGR